MVLQKLKCQRKEPCRLFSVKPKAGQGAGQEGEEVTMSSLCSCPHSRRCPRHHTDVGVVPGRSYSEQVQFGHFDCQTLLTHNCICIIVNSKHGLHVCVSGRAHLLWLLHVRAAARMVFLHNQCCDQEHQLQTEPPRLSPCSSSDIKVMLKITTTENRGERER